MKIVKLNINKVYLVYILTWWGYQSIRDFLLQYITEGREPKREIILLKVSPIL